MATSPEEVDAVLDKMELGVKKVDAAQSSMVRLRKAEFDLLDKMAAIRDLIQSLLKGGDRDLLREIFADCGRIGRLRAVLESVTFSEMNAKDQRFPLCVGACDSLEELLRKDLGLGEKLDDVKKRKSHSMLEARVSILMDPAQVDALKAQITTEGEGEAEAEEEEDVEASEDEDEEDEDDDDDDYDDEVEELPPRSASGEQVAEDEFITTARRMFEELDQNGDGMVSKIDLRKAARSSKELLQNLRLRSGKQFSKFFKKVADEQTGEVDFDGFLGYLKILREQAAARQQKRMVIDDATLVSVFEAFDHDADGQLSLQELKMAYAGVRLKAGRRVDKRRVAVWCKKNLKKYDTDGSKTLNLEEFRRLLENSGALMPMMRQAEEGEQ